MTSFLSWTSKNYVLFLVNVKKRAKMDQFPTVEPTYAAWLQFRIGSFEESAQTATEVLKMDRRHGKN